jgi:hypothetical protein
MSTCKLKARGKIKVMRYLLWAWVAVLSLGAVYAADPVSVAVRGHLRQEPGKAPYIETADHKHVELKGDEATTKVLNDARLKDSDFEVEGHWTGENHFEINGMYLPSLFVYRNGKRLQVSYWCDVCYIRTSSPGKCWCCQRPTALDPVEPEH